MEENSCSTKYIDLRDIGIDAKIVIQIKTLTGHTNLFEQTPQGYRLEITVIFVQFFIASVIILLII